LFGNQSTPDGVTFGPEIFAFVVKTLRIPIYDNAEWYAIEPGNDPPVKFGRPCIYGNSMALPGVPHGSGTPVEQHAEHPSLVVRCTADNEIFGGFSPVRL